MARKRLNTFSLLASVLILITNTLQLLLNFREMLNVMDSLALICRLQNHEIVMTYSVVSQKSLALVLPKCCNVSELVASHYVHSNQAAIMRS